MKFWKIFIGSVVVPITLMAQIPTEGLVAHYMFDNNVRDTSVSDRHGIQVNGIKFCQDRYNNIAKALELNGTDSYVSINDIVVYKTVTFSLWFNLSALPEEWHHADCFYYINKKNEGGYYLGYTRLENGTYKLLGQIWTGNQYPYYRAEVELDINRWYHYALTYNENTKAYKLYLDGNILLALQNIPATFDTVNRDNESYIGRYYMYYPVNPGADYFYGKLDDFRIYNRALSDSEVRALFGAYIFTGIEKNRINQSSLLGQNYPNPFNPVTTINYCVPSQSHVEIRVYDVLGKQVALLADEYKAAGNYKIIFNGGNLPSGIYYYRLIMDNFAETKKLILLK